jgi:streptogramin lyase
MNSSLIKPRSARVRAAASVVAVLLLGATVPAVAAAAPLGSLTTFSAGLGASSFPNKMIAGPDGNLWFADQSQAIGRVTPAGVITLFDTGAGSVPEGVAVGPDGDVWFTDGGAPAAIGRITPSGVITRFTTGLGADRLPFAIAAGADGNLWFTSQSDPNASSPAPAAIGRITPSGTITEFTTGLDPSTSNPYEIVAGPDGNVWFADLGTGALGRVTPAGTITELPVATGASPYSITAGPDGNLWFTDPGYGGNPAAIGRMTTGGTVTEFTAGLDPGARPGSLGRIVAAADGNLWFVDSNLDPGFVAHPALGRITAGGSITEFTDGLSANQLGVIAPGLDGNLWVSVAAGGVDPAAIARFGLGAPAASIAAPVVAGSGQQGTPQACQGDRWSSWAGQQPVIAAGSALDGYQWRLDGAPIASATGRAYTPAPGDVGHGLSCTVTTTYSLFPATVRATSDSVTVTAASAGPAGATGAAGANGAAGSAGGTGATGSAGPAGPAGATGPAGPKGADGKVQLVTCKTQTTKVDGKKRTRQVCTTKTVTGTVKFTTSGGAKVASASLLRGAVVYAKGTSRRTAKATTLALTPLRRLTRGSYTLKIGTRRETITLR